MIGMTDMVDGGKHVAFKHGRSGYSRHRCRCDVCREGAAEYKKAYRIANPEKCRESDKKARMKDPEGLRAHARDRYANNPRERERKRAYRNSNLERCKAYSRNYHVEHREEEAAYQRARCDANPEEKRLQLKKWRDAHRNEYRKWTNEYQSRRRMDSDYRMTMNLRHRIKRAIRRGTKSAGSMELIGCGAAELRAHLERQFRPGMTWDNYGLKGWHVDHIKPCSAFDLTVPGQQKECFHWSNLQPLWASENHIKSDKWSDDNSEVGI